MINKCNLTDFLNVTYIPFTVVAGAQQIEVAEGILARFGGDVQRIYKAHVAELGSVRGVGQQTAVRIKAALALGLRLTEPTGERPVINSLADAAALVQPEMSLLEQEFLRVMLLDTRNRLLDIVEVYHGAVNSSQVRLAEVFKPAIQRMAPAIQRPRLTTWRSPVPWSRLAGSWMWICWITWSSAAAATCRSRNAA